LEVNEREAGAARASLIFERLRGKLFSEPANNIPITFHNTEDD
jgi:hypothetical protein